VWCLVTPWPLTPPVWLAAVAAVLSGASVAGAALALRGAFRLVRRVLNGGAAGSAPWVALLPLVVAVAVPGQPAPGPGPASATISAASVGVPAISTHPDTAIGEEGRAFLSLPSSTPLPPVRTYVPEAAGDDADRAALAVATLRRAGGMERSTVLVAVPTGSGWVDGAAVTSLDERLGGDVASVAVQYAHRPSWVEFLLGGDTAARSAAATVRAVRATIDAQPPGHRPRLLVFGESLGAAAALPVAGLTDGCLLAGRPGSLGTASACTEVRNADDPVTRWSGHLLLTNPVAFWQVTASLLVAQDAGPDHGHLYTTSLGPAWASEIRRRDGLGPGGQDHGRHKPHAG
jgi:hypothetical protein